MIFLFLFFFFGPGGALLVSAFWWRCMESVLVRGKGLPLVMDKFMFRQLVWIVEVIYSYFWSFHLMVQTSNV